MSISRPVAIPNAPLCVCSKTPKAYVTDDKTFHLECFPCKIITPRLSNIHAATAEFRRMCDTVRADRNMPTRIKLVSTGTQIK